MAFVRPYGPIYVFFLSLFFLSLFFLSLFFLSFEVEVEGGA